MEVQPYGKYYLKTKPNVNRILVVHRIRAVRYLQLAQVKRTYVRTYLRCRRNVFFFLRLFTGAQYEKYRKSFFFFRKTNPF